MAIEIDQHISPADLLPGLKIFWDLSAEKIRNIRTHYDPAKGSPVFTAAGNYTTRGWTEWTQGFEFGSELLQYDATGEIEFLESGRKNTLDKMAPHLTHTGVHDHGFNNVSTYGNLLRFIREGRMEASDWEQESYEVALKCSGAVQAMRWSEREGGGGYIYSFNGPHSLFADTIRSLRSLAVAHQLGHVLLRDHDEEISLLDRLIDHADATAQYTVYYGDGRDAYDVSGRVAHESIFNLNDGRYRCPNSQQGYSPFSTWTRGLAWVMTGFAEQLEFLRDLPRVGTYNEEKFQALEVRYLRAAKAVCDFYLENTPTDGIPYWDTGAPELYKVSNILERPADPFNDYEPVDSSAAAIAAQGLLRLGHYLKDEGRTYWQAGLTVMKTLLDEPYLSTDAAHQGLILHSIYHRPNGWDHIPDGRKIPCGESSMWGDYHAREAALYVQRMALDEPYLKFYVK